MGLRRGLKTATDTLQDRTGLPGVLRHAADHPVRGGARYAYAFGSALVFVFILQVVTGIALASTYSPSVTDAWGSVFHIQHHIVMGSFVRAVHHFGSSAMIVLCVLHMTQVLLFGAHRNPREINWWLGLLMMALILAFGLTGYLLPWDQNGYWATQVATGIIGGTPGGETLQAIVQGGSTYGNATLTRFYALHTLVLPPALIGLLVGHIALFYRHGVKRSPRSERSSKQRPTQAFWPFQMARDVILMAIVFGAIAALALLVGVGLDAPADPASGYQARPEWYFLFLFQLLKYFEGPLTLIGTVVIPGAAMLFLFAAPLIDRKRPEPGASFKVLVPYGVLILGAMTLTVVAMAGDANDPAVQKARAAAEADAERAQELAHLGGIDAAGRVVFHEALKVYEEQSCAGCHDDPKAAAPRLAGFGSRERLSAFLTAPSGPRFFGGGPLDGMMDPAQGTPAELKALTDWLYAESGRSHVSAGAAKAARAAFTAQECGDCHNAPGGDPFDDEAWDMRATGPDLSGLFSYEWTRALLRNAQHPRFFGGAIEADDREDTMPAYPDLSPDELELLTRWLIGGAPGAL